MSSPANNTSGSSKGKPQPSVADDEDKNHTWGTEIRGAAGQPAPSNSGQSAGPPISHIPPPPQPETPN
ncbi:hypothetical protein FRC04_008628 [Tulasnella sp. 424]|nr:hypothetical protein FRC04_008628 [Tulasnella sp. 424]KAG8970758.1 hypothetical protein FRC05_011709 [Tulasnella sp. 425]